MLFKQLKVLSDEEINLIIDAGFDVMENVGCRFDSAWARKQFKETGCTLIDAQSVIRITRNKADEFLKTIPRLDPKLSRAALHLPGAAHTSILNPGATKSRPAVTSDVKDIIRISNALECLQVISAGVLPTDVPDGAADAVNAALLFQYSKKPFVQQPYSRNSARVMLSMAEVVYGGMENLKARADFGYLLAGKGSLRYTRASLELARMYASCGLPLVIGSRSRMGEEAPATVAGSLVMLVAEFIAGVAFAVVAQCPAPVALSDGMRAVDSNGKLRLSGPEQVVRMLGARQIAEKLGFVAAPFIGETDSSGFDFAAGWEKSVATVYNWAAGADPFGPAGNMPEAFSIPQLLLDHEGKRMIARLIDGVTVDEDHMAISTLEQVGIGGHFLGEDHTLDHMRDFWEPRLFSRASYDDWLAQGAPGIEKAAVEKAREMLVAEKIEPAIAEDKALEVQKLSDAYLDKCRKSECAEEEPAD